MVMISPITSDKDAIIKPTIMRSLLSVFAQEINENMKKRLNVKPMTPIEAPTNLF